METKELKITIPEGYVIDEEKSTFMNIVFKPKSLTYDDVAKKLFENKETYFITKGGEVKSCSCGLISALDPNNATTEHQLKCILAKNKLANVARYLNGEWHTVLKTEAWYLTLYSGERIDTTSATFEYAYISSRIAFKSKELAQQAIEILGEEEVKLALEPLY